jgi:hypothetical protein
LYHNYNIIFFQKGKEKLEKGVKENMVAKKKAKVAAKPKAKAKKK